MNAFDKRSRMPGAEAFEHGTRARYTRGCRCRLCTSSNVARYHERQARGIALAKELVAPPPAPLRRTWLGPDGPRSRVFRHSCPGVLGQPCPIRSYLRKDSKGGCCRACRERLVWDGLVPAAAALEHVKRLSRAGVGYKSVAAAADVSSTTIMAMRAGRKTRIRASTEARILGVDRAAVADGAKVQAGRAWKRIRSLLEEGYSKAELARRLGKRQPALQLGRGRMTAINASMVERLYRTIMEVPA